MTAILVIRGDDGFSSTLRGAGFDVVHLELIETKPIEDLSELRAKLAKLIEYDGIFFTSPVAAEIFIRERKGSNGFYGNVYVLGRRAESVLEAAGLNIKTSKHANSAERMLSEFGSNEFAGKRFLFIRGEKSMRTIPDTLADIAVVDEVAVYRTEPKFIDEKTIDSVRSRLSVGEFEFVCFFSPSGVERFAELFGNEAKTVKAAAIGQTTAEAARNARVNIDFISPTSNADSFARSLIEHVRQAVSLSK